MRGPGAVLRPRRAERRLTGLKREIAMSEGEPGTWIEHE